MKFPHKSKSLFKKADNRGTSFTRSLKGPLLHSTIRRPPTPFTMPAPPVTARCRSPHRMHRYPLLHSPIATPSISLTYIQALYTHTRVRVRMRSAHLDSSSGRVQAEQRARHVEERSAVISRERAKKKTQREGRDD